MKFFCPKCGLENIKIEVLNSKRPERISLDNAGKMQVIKAVYFPTKYKGICKDCGYTREWSA